LFRRLAVFVGGCTLEAAEAVCGEDEGPRTKDQGGVGPCLLGPDDVFERIASLVDKSLLQQDEAGDGEPRFSMLETIREYGLERLEGAGEAGALRRRHAEWCLAFVEEAEPKLRT